MPRRGTFSRQTKLDAFDRANGHCEKCDAHLIPGKFEYHHFKPVAMFPAGTDPKVIHSLANCRVWCINCHGQHTAKVDVPTISKAKRKQAKHVGAKAPSKNPIRGRGFNQTPKPKSKRAVLPPLTRGSAQIRQAWQKGRKGEAR